MIEILEVDKENSAEESDSRSTKSLELIDHERELEKSRKQRVVRSANATPQRLTGGADSEPENPENPNAKEDFENGNRDTADDTSTSPEFPPESPAEKPQPLPTTGDPRVDEMLECALRNLDEACKALASLGENVEHELKLFLVELMGRSRKWTGHVESKIEWTRRDIMSLHKELSARIAELSDSRRLSSELKAQLAQSEAQKLRSQKSVTDSFKNGKAEGRGAPSAQRSVQLGTESCCQSRSVLHGEGPIDIAAARAEEERLVSCCEQLEQEVQCLRKENERMTKERAEYENAIQRALLKGVSSLNVEALKVLRCTPIATCCPPCPPSTTIEPVSKSGRDYGQSSRNQCGNGNGNRGGMTAMSCRSANGNGNGCNSRDNVSRRTCPAAEKKSRKSRDSNMLLLLHQKDAENFGVNTSCDNSSKKTTVCGGGNCGNGKRGGC